MGASVVTGQLEPSASLLYTVVPGQQPKGAEEHPPALMTTSALVTIAARESVVTGQLDPAASLFITAVPGQQPKGREEQRSAVVTKCTMVGLVVIDA